MRSLLEDRSVTPVSNALRGYGNLRGLSCSPAQRAIASAGEQLSIRMRMLDHSDYRVHLSIPIITAIAEEIQKGKD